MPRIAAVVIDDIKQINIVDIISPHVQLERKGNSTRGLCPFHSEKTPSFNVREDKGFFKCFGCNESGDSITFIMKHLNLDWQGAVEYICENYGIELRYEDGGAPNIPTQGLKDFHNAVLEYAVKELFTDTGKRALDYLYKRNFSKNDIESFQIGYLPPHLAATRFEKQFSHSIMKESGIFFDTKYGLRCFFGDRILFPIHNRTGSCVGFSGRSMDPDDKAKYKNSPETAIFSKRRELFNLHRAKDAMKESRNCYIVEGYFDAMRMSINGYPETVAIMGTAFTKDQVNQLKRYCEEYNLILDGDAAGQKAMRDSRTVAVETNVYPHIIMLPEGDDPDTFIANNGKDAFDKIVAGKEDLITYTIKSEREKAANDNQRFNRLEYVKTLLKSLQNSYRREFYTAQAAKLFAVSEDMLNDDVNIGQTKRPVINTYNKKGNAINIYEMDFISCLLQLPEENIYSIVCDLKAEHFEDEKMQLLFNKIIAICEQNDNISFLLRDEEIGSFATELTLRTQNEDLYAEAVRNKYSILIKYYENARIAHKLKISQIQNDDEKIKALAEEQKLINIIIQLKAKAGRETSKN